MEKDLEEMAKFKGKYRIESARLKGYDYSSEGSYFITICAHKMQHFFGHIENEKMHLNEIGKLAEKFWKEIPEHFPRAILHEFVIMPNHMHGIITLTPIKTNAQTSHCDVSIPNTESPNDLEMNVQTSQCDVSIPNTEYPNNLETNVQTSHCDVSIPNTESPNNLEMNVQTSQCDVSLNPPKEIDITTTMETAQCDVSTKKQKMAAIRPKSGSLSVIIRSYKSVVSKHAHKISKNFEWQERFYDRIIRDENEFARIANYIQNNPKNWDGEEIFL